MVSSGTARRPPAVSIYGTATAPLWAETVPATDAARRIQQLRYLVRGPVGDETVVGYASGGGATRSATLEAVDDEYATLNAATVHAVKSSNPLDIFTTRLVTSDLLDSGYGYIDVDSFMFSARQPRVAGSLRLDHLGLCR